MIEGRPNQSPPELSIVVINWNRSAETRACLARLAEWTRLQPTVWVVDNASSDDSLERIASEFPAVRLVASASNLGFGGGNNLALRNIAGGHTLLLNNDARIDEESVRRLIEALDRQPNLAIVGPVLVDEENPHEILCAGGRNIARHVGTHLTPGEVAGRLRGNEPYEVEYVPGTVALLRAGLLDETGLFDEAYFFAGEMADLCERARNRGHGVAVVPTAKASHDTGQAQGLRVSLYPYYILRNRFLYVRKLERRWLIPLYLFWGAYGVFAALRALLSGDRGSARLAILALVDGLNGRFGDQNERVLESTGPPYDAE